MRITQLLSLSSRLNRNQKKNAVWVLIKEGDLYDIGNVKQLVPKFYDKESMYFITRTFNFTWN